MKKIDIEASLIKFLLNLKEEVIKEYDEEECDKNIVYIFNNEDEFRDYFIKNGVDNVDSEIINFCKFKTTRKGKIIALKGLCDHYISKYNEMAEIDRIKYEYDIGYSNYDLEKLSFYKNVVSMRDNLINFYPTNDGRSTMPIFFRQDDMFVIDNMSAFCNITNLDEILLKMIDIFDKSLDNGDIINPYGFMLELTDKIMNHYYGRANLVFTDKSIINVDDSQKKEARAYFVNRFLDHFMGWNFGLTIKKNEEVETKLNGLNDKVIDMGIREYAGSGFEVVGVADYPVNGVQHYYLPVEKDNKKRTNK